MRWQHHGGKHQQEESVAAAAAHAGDGATGEMAAEERSNDARSRVFRGEIHHAPWPLQTEECECAQRTRAEAIGVRLPASPSLAHFSARLEVVAWTLRAID